MTALIRKQGVGAERCPVRLTSANTGNAWLLRTLLANAPVGPSFPRAVTRPQTEHQ